MNHRAPDSYMKFLLILLIAALFFGCNNQQEKLVGKYTAMTSGSAESVLASLELLSDGRGFWSIETDNAPFRWDFYQSRVIRLHTKSGGVIEGTLDQDTIEFNLPGMGVIRFQRKQ